MSNLKNIKIIRPDDWHIHLREGGLLECVIKSSTRVTGKCIVMPNLAIPITTSLLCEQYKKEITKLAKTNYFKPYIPCYLTDHLNLNDFDFALRENIFIGAKLSFQLRCQFSSSWTSQEKLISNLEEVKARGGKLYIFADEISEVESTNGMFVLNINNVYDYMSPIIHTIPLQLLAYYVAVIKGADIDQPRNLAKSVTVE